MSAFRRNRGWVSTWLIAALLFMQLAVAAHACVPAAPRALPVADMPDCPHHRTHHRTTAPPEASTLCKAHCEAGLQSVNSQAGALDAPPVLALPAALRGGVDVQASAERAALQPAALAAGPPAARTPIYLSLLVLRN